MKYTVVVKEFISSNGSYKRRRFNNVNKRIIKFLLKHKFSFKVGIANYMVNLESAQNYIEVYLKGSANRHLDNLLMIELSGQPYHPFNDWKEVKKDDY